MNTASIISQFELVEKSIARAKLPFETDMLQKEVIEVSLYELIRSYHQIENLIREIEPQRFGLKQIQKYVLQTPEISVDRLHLCPFCGDPECQSDHK